MACSRFPNTIFSGIFPDSAFQSSLLWWKCLRETGLIAQRWLGWSGKVSQGWGWKQISLIVIGSVQIKGSWSADRGVGQLSVTSLFPQLDFDGIKHALVLGFESRLLLRSQKYYFKRHFRASKIASTKARWPVHGLTSAWSGSGNLEPQFEKPRFTEPWPLILGRRNKGHYGRCLLTHSIYRISKVFEIWGLQKMGSLSLFLHTRGISRISLESLESLDNGASRKGPSFERPKAKCKCLQVLFSLQPRLFMWYLHGKAHPNGWPTEPADAIDSAFNMQNHNRTPGWLLTTRARVRIQFNPPPL